MQSADEEPRDPFVQSLFIAADASLADTGFTDKTMQAVTRAVRQSRRRRVIGWGCALLSFFWLAANAGGEIQMAIAAVADRLMLPLLPVHDPLLAALFAPVNHLGALILSVGAIVCCLHRLARPRRPWF